MIHDLVDLCKNKFAREARQRIQKMLKFPSPFLNLKQIVKVYKASQLKKENFKKRNFK